MAFLHFARSFATNGVISENLTVDESSVTSDMRERTACTISNVKNKINRMDSCEIPYISKALSDPDVVAEYLESIGGDVNNWILVELSEKLYGKGFCDLDADQQAIIKTLGVYIMVSLKDN